MPLVLLIQSLCDQNAITGDERSYETQFEKRGGLVFINFSKIYWIIHTYMSLGFYDEGFFLHST